MTAWHWWTQTNAGLASRIILGASFFVFLAVTDLLHQGRDATRWREYLFLVVAVVAALAYGVVNDQITSRVSWEYFYYGKQLDKILGPVTPPDAAALHRQAAIVGMKATWTVGLLIGVCLLLANNPSRSLPRLRYRTLFGAIVMIFIAAAACAIMGGVAGWNGWLTWMATDFRDMWRADVLRPRHFLCTYGIHLGGYTGGLIGTIAAVAWVRRQRRHELASLSR